jgi:folate-binding protein YgfZ
MQREAFLLAGRGVVEVKGPDARSFLQGLVTNDVERLAEGEAVYAALLTPQGKIITDFFVASAGEALLLDCAASAASDLAARLKKYKLRARVDIADRASGLCVAALPVDAKVEGVANFADPRLAELGRRAIGGGAQLEAAVTSAGCQLAPEAGYERRRLALGVPDTKDMPPETAFPLDCNFEELHGVDFKKGCYIGQELTARMKHRATARKRFLPVSGSSPLPAYGTVITLAGIPIGEMKSSLDGLGLAVIRLDRLGTAKEVEAGGAMLAIGMPAYALILPQGEAS